MADSSANLAFTGNKGKGILRTSKKSKSIAIDSETVPEWITVNISIREYRNLVNMYPTGDIKTTCEFDGTIIGESCLLPLAVVNDNDTIKSKDSFTLRINKKCPKDIDKLLSLPAILSVHQTIFDYNLKKQCLCAPALAAAPGKPVDSQCGIYEGIVDKNMNFALEDMTSFKREKFFKKTTKKSVCLIEDSKSEISDTRWESNRRKSMSAVYGICVIDFLPLFRGRCKFSEILPMKQVVRFEDDRMTTYKRIPTIVIDVSIDTLLNYDTNTIVHFTLESIYNLPPMIAEEMTCTVATHFPSFENSVCGPILFKNAVFTSEKQHDQFKCWPNMPLEGNNANTTKYRMNHDKHEKNCKLDTNLQPETPRLVFNMMKRVLMDQFAIDKLRSQEKKFKHLLMELYFAEKGSHIIKSFKTPSKAKDICDLHCMALVKISTLINPGVTKLRIAVPIKTFSTEEMKTSLGISASMFAPLVKRKPVIKYSKYHSSKELMKDKEKEKTAKANRTSQTTKSDVKLDWKRRISLLTQHSGVELFNETSSPVFAIVEIELTKPILPEMNTGSLGDRMAMLLTPLKPVQNKNEVFRNSSDQEGPMHFQVAYSNSIDYFVRTISKVALDLEGKFARYLGENPESEDYWSFHYSRLLEFLDKIGTYNRYDSTIRDALSLVNYTKSAPSEVCAYDIVCDVTKFDLLFKNASEILHRMIEQLRGIELTELKRNSYFFAEEALEMGMILNGERIMLERICMDDQNADYWFEYAIFLIERKQLNKARECVYEGLGRNCDHKFCLLLYGMLLEEQNLRTDAEKVLLNVVRIQPKWFEGWAVLYLFYKRHADYLDMQYAFGEARNCIIGESVDDSFHLDDLTYGAIDTQQSIHFRLVRFLIKVRMFSWAEMHMISLTQERCISDVTYLSAVISYYKQDYEKCIEALKKLQDTLEEQKISIIALQAHCLAKLGRGVEALIYYKAILENQHLYPRCHLMRFIILKCAKVLIENHSDENLVDARNILFPFCECELSPLAWLLLGSTYYLENFHQTATRCFKVGLLLDYRNEDIWILLALANIEFYYLSQKRYIQ